MNKYPLLMCLAIALLGFNFCATEQPNKNSGDVGATPDKGVAQNATPSPTSTNTSARPLSSPSNSIPSPVVSPPNGVPGGRAIQITDDSYEQEVVQSQIPVLIIFWAPWSAPDRMIMPTIEAVANEYAGKVKVGKVNVDENAELAGKFSIRAIPTIILIKNRSERDRVVGVTSKEAIGRMLDQQLENNP